jgi:tricarballylate dehydrogenase
MAAGSELRADVGADVLVLGAGNAALCAALAARERGASVLVLESAPRELRSGNSRHTRNLRCMHEAPTDVLTDAYLEDEYLSDLLRVTGGRTDEALARMTIRSSADCTPWMKRHGVRFQPSLGGTLHLGRTNAFFLGGGKALMNTYYAAAQRLGIRIVYGAEVAGVEISGSRCRSVTFTCGGKTTAVKPKSVVAAAGGFESNLRWLKEAWGDAADNFLIRGTPYNTGKLLRAMLDQNVQSVGDPTQGHSVAIDARAPKFDGGIVTRLDCVSLGIVVNRNAERFYDEGEDFWPKRYAIWGRLVAQQPEQIAYSIIDAKSMGRFMPSVYPAIRSETIEGLARELGLPAAKLAETVARYNAAVQPGEFDHSVLDGCCTRGLAPEKTHWATRLDTPPFYGYPLRPGITFTYLGVKVDERARVQMKDGRPLDNLFAAGEIMAGNILGQGYLAGFGMTIGTVFGRIAGKEAAHAAR